MAYAYRVSTIFELCDFSAISKDHFKCLLFLSGSRELFPTDACCRFLRMLKASDRIALENIVNECINLNIKCDSGMSPQKSGEHNCVNRISTGTVSRNVSTP
ncbi:unnamed protein product [Hymenolepis diminuta]|uniref:Uncharacterized protein n=1 Tax=Hymenolepis diminuta TaxID=6216 RepID=A0A564YNW5_HYMDI|nr:unnamed protein product [Hymenolepis diminuta]